MPEEGKEIPVDVNTRDNNVLRTAQHCKPYSPMLSALVFIFL
jgi:hypothetical protein